MKNKKLGVLICIFILIGCSIFVNSVNARIFTTKKSNEEKIIENKEAQLYKKSIIKESDEVNWEKGFLKVSSKGKGLAIIFKIKLLKINSRIITPQYDRFFPFTFDDFATFFVYNDENATTKIEQKGKDPVYINGSHALFMGVYKLPILGIMISLMQDGIIDGFQRFQSPSEYGSKGPVALVITKMIHKIFGGPLIDISNETHEFFDYLKGIFPRYNPSKPLLNTTFAIKYRDTMRSILGKNADYIMTMIRYWTYLLPTAMFWNRMPVRSSLLQFKQTMVFQGYTPFVRWTKSSKLQPFVEKVQNAIPDIVYDEPEEFRDYGD